MGIVWLAYVWTRLVSDSALSSERPDDLPRSRQRSTHTWESIWASNICSGAQQQRSSKFKLSQFSADLINSPLLLSLSKMRSTKPDLRTARRARSQLPSARPFAAASPRGYCGCAGSRRLGSRRNWRRPPWASPANRMMVALLSIKVCRRARARAGCTWSRRARSCPPWCASQSARRTRCPAVGAPRAAGRPLTGARTWISGKEKLKVFSCHTLIFSRQPQRSVCTGCLCRCRAGQAQRPHACVYRTFSRVASV